LANGTHRSTLLAAALLPALAAARTFVPPNPPSPPQALLETRRFPWSPPAWAGLRWGMGIRDVARESPAACGGSSDFRWQGRQAGMRRAGLLVTYERCSWDFLGEATEPSFWFGEKGLAAVEVHLGEREACTVVQPRFERLRGELTARHGPPTCVPYADGEGCRWRAGADQVTWLFLGRLAQSELTPALADPGLCNVFAVVEDPRQAPRTASWEIPSSFPSSTTEPASWARTGPLGIRWGMGPEDVRRRVGRASPPLGGPTRAFCFQQEAPYYLQELPTEVQCQLTVGPGPGNHLATFTRGRLSALRLDFPDAGPEALAAATAALEGGDGLAMRCRWDEAPVGLGTVRSGACVGPAEKATVRIQRTGARTDLSVEIAPLPQRPRPAAPGPGSPAAGAGPATVGGAAP
jgi:hypothetical protein